MNEVWNENYFLQYVSYDWLLCHRHANVYREWQNDGELNYNISAKAENCHLLPVERQTFIILRAGAKGKGMSMGQSSIQYAGSEYAKKEFVLILCPKKHILLIIGCEELKFSELANDYNNKLEKLDKHD